MSFMGVKEAFLIFEPVFLVYRMALNHICKNIWLDDHPLIS